MWWASILGFLLFIQYILGLSLYLIGLVLISINELVLDGAGKAIIKQKLEGFWIFTAELSTTKRLSEVLRARRQWVRRRIAVFIKIFWFMLLIVFAGSVGSTIRQSSSDLRKTVIGNMNFDLTFEIERTYLTTTTENYSCIPDDLDCQDWINFAGLESTRGLVQLKDKYIEFVNNIISNHIIIIKFADAGISAASLIIIAIPLTISLLISFNLTLWMLSKITDSSMALVIMILGDLLSAFVMPPLILTIVIYIAALCVVFITGGLTDYSSFGDINIWNFSISSLALSFTGAILFPTISAWVIYNTPGILWHIIVAVITLAIALYLQLTQFFSDVSHVIRLNARVDVIHSAINWAIIVDITYSLYYVAPSILFVFSQRSDAGREIILDNILSIAYHPKGALYAVGKKLMISAAAAADFLKKWSGGPDKK